MSCSVAARWAAGAILVAAVEDSSEKLPSIRSGQGFAANQVVAALLAAWSSSAAASVVVPFTRMDTERRLAAAARAVHVRRGSDAPLILGLISLHGAIGQWSVRAFVRILRLSPASDSCSARHDRIEPFGP